MFSIRQTITSGNSARRGISTTSDNMNEIESIQPLISNLSSVAHLEWMLAIVAEMIVHKLHYRMLWIGLAEKDTTEVKPVIQRGFEEGYLSRIKVRYDTSALGMGPTGTAVREGRTVAQHDMATDPRYAPWRDEALKRGYRSSIALPLKIGKSVIGALNIYSEKQDAFKEEEEVRLLERFSELISYAIERARHNVPKPTFAVQAKGVRKPLQKPLNSGTIYISKYDLDETLTIFRNHLVSGWSGLCIGRQSVSSMLRREWLRDVPIFQLIGDVSQPNAIWGYSNLLILVSSFLCVTKKPFVFIEGLEELERSFEKGNLPVFLKEVRRRTSETGAIALIHLEFIQDPWLDIIEENCAYV